MANHYIQTRSRGRALHAVNTVSSLRGVPPPKCLKSCDSSASPVDFVVDTSTRESKDDVGSSDFSFDSDDSSDKTRISTTADCFGFYVLCWAPMEVREVCACCQSTWWSD